MREPSAKDKQLTELEGKLNRLLSFCVEGIKEMCGDVVLEQHNVKEQGTNVATANTTSNGDENFEGWLPLTIDGTRAFSYDLNQLKDIRDNCRSLMSNTIYKNIIKHYRNHIVGDGLIYELVKKDLGKDPASVAQEKVDSVITQMTKNWEAFEAANDFNGRLASSLEKVMRDGECPWRFFPQGTSEAPLIRFMEPSLIDGTNAADKSENPYAQRYGVKTKPQDIETILSYYYNVNQDNDTVRTNQSQPITIPADSVVFIKRNTDYEFPRGVPDFWSVLTNIRRADKIVRNTSVLIQIQSSIALIRKHKGSTQPRIANFVRNKSDGQQHTSVVTGKNVMAQNFRQGMILDTNELMDYEMPSVGVKPEGFIAAAINELTAIGCAFVLPLDWMIGKEPQEPLAPGSPTIMNFKAEQGWFYSYIEKAFWKVQELMGMDTKKLKTEYDLNVEGPFLAVGKILDQARAMQVVQQCAGISPQTIARRFGVKYNVERANTIRHRKSLQPGEVAPGDLGNTDPGTNNGLNSKDKGTKVDGASGGNTRV